jgi:hypothetical protein
MQDENKLIAVRREKLADIKKRVMPIRMISGVSIMPSL